MILILLLDKIKHKTSVTNETDAKINIGTKYPFTDLMHNNPAIKVIAPNSIAVYEIKE